MKRVSAHDVAAEIRSRLSNPGVVKVHKLLYYCQAWHIVSTGEPLFTEDIQAWANGPVVADFWHDEDKHRNPPPARSLDSEGLATIAYVITRYGHLSGADLIRLTHNEAPWLDASVAFGTGLVTIEALGAFFSADDEAEAVSQTDPDVSPRLRAFFADVVRGASRPAAPDAPDELDRRLRELQAAG